MSQATSPIPVKRLVRPIPLLLATLAVAILLLSWIAKFRDIENGGNPPLSSRDQSHKTIDETYGRIEMSFEANQGQIDESVDFLARGLGYTLFLTANEATFSLSGDQNKENSSEDATTGATDNSKRSSLAVRLKIIGGNAAAKPIGKEQLAGKTNYLTGRDPGKWRTNVPTFNRVSYENVYDGIDVEYYGNQRQLEYDFHVAPGADYRKISLTFDGSDSVEIEERTGDLIINVNGQEVRQHRPIVYQKVAGDRREVESRFTIGQDEKIGFELGEYDPTLPIVIDPILVFSSFFGGSDRDRGYAIAVDPAGSAYITGSTLSFNFPIANPIRSFNAGINDAFVMKLNPAGDAVVYSTYIGGESDDFGFDIAVDPGGNAFITGSTDSFDFPTANAIYSTFRAPRDAFITKLNPTGSAFVYSSYLGGSNQDYANGIALDQTGAAYVTGFTVSSNFPTMNPIQTPGPGISLDAFVTKINSSGSALVYSTYLGGNLGGSAEDEGNAIAVDSDGNVYVAGRTLAQNFPTVNPIQPANASSDTSSEDAFVTKINAAGSAIIYSTYIGGVSVDSVEDIALDSSGNAYVTGTTTSNNFPTTNPIQAAYAGGVDAFVTKINAAGSAFVYSTYLGGGTGVGGNGNDYGNGIAVDVAGQAYITGITTSTDFPTANALQNTYAGSTDIFITKINSAGTALAYSTYLGRASGEGGFSAALNSANELYVTGDTSSTNFPLINPIQAFNGGQSDMFVFKISDGPAPTPTPGASPIPTPTPSPVPSPTPMGQGLVISQIYGGGGTGGAIYRNSYVEIFNRNATPVVINAYAIAVGLGTSPIDRSYGRSSSQGFVIQPGQYLLVRMGSGGGSGAELPQPDVDAQTVSPGFPSSFFGLTGKIALTGVGANQTIFADCPLGAPGLLDFVGFGATNCFEGSGSTGGLSVTTAALRKNQGCFETNDNAADFTIGVPTPRNSSSPFTPCSGQVVATPTPTPSPSPTPIPTPTPTPAPSPTPTPLGLSMAGRTVNDTGIGIRSQIVVITRDDGFVQTATTSSFGVFSFEGLQAGRTYVVSVRSKRYRFAPRVIELSANITDIVMIALE